MSSTVLLAPPPNLLQGPSREYLPFIVDNSYGSFDSEILGDRLDRNGALLASSEESEALLSMSDYGKVQYRNTKEPDSSRPPQESMYVAYTQPGLVQPHMQSQTIPYNTQQESMSYGTSALYQQRPSQEHEESTYASSRARSVPQITSWRPQQGSYGTRVFIYLLSGFEIDPLWTFQIKFASRQCQSNLTKLERQGSLHQYMLSTEVPPFTTTGWPNTRVPLRIYVQDGSGNEVALIDVGGFNFADVTQPSPRMTPEHPRKRKMSPSSGDASDLPAKRTSSQQLGSTNSDDYETTGYSYIQQSTQSYLQQQAQQSSMVDASRGSILPSYQRTPSQMAHSQSEPQDSPGRVPRHLSQSSVSALSQLRGPSPQTPSWAATNIPTKSPSLPNAPLNRMAAMASPSMMANPPLIRTSTLQQSPSPVVTPSGPSVTSGFNPYAVYPSKAVLKINGNLDTMTTGWNSDEYEAKRRLVQFRRSQSGSTISTDFKPVAPEDRQPNSICISCILWEAKDEYYVTSVDTIYLLESLVAVRFTVEEKNRIRRNLEGFRPMTVSKGRLESEDFFKLIMSFPNPKPRNIEKDVKVFPWKILSHALKKIIGKYSASYSSTAGTLPTSVSSGYRTSQAHDLVNDLIPASPHHPGQEPGISAAYSSGLTASTISSLATHDRLSNPYTTGSPSMMHLAHAPNYSTSYHFAPQPALSQNAGAMPMVAQQHPHQQQSQQQQQQRPPSWDFAAFMDAPTSGPAGHGLYSLDNNTDSNGHYQMTHASSGS